MSNPSFNERANRLTNKATALTVILVAIVFFVADHYGPSGQALVAASSVGVIVAATNFFWDLRKKIWFWLTMIVIGAIHIVLVFAIPWRSGPFPAPFLIPILFCDFALIYSWIRWEEKLEGGNGD